MENFDWTQFTRKILVKASLKQMYDAWTIPLELEKWFLESAEYTDAGGNLMDRSKNFDKGASYAWTWFTYPVTEKGKVTEANGKDFHQFTFAGECLVEVSLTQHGDGVIVALTQKDIPTDDASKVNIRLGCDSGWSFYLANIKSVYEGGVDLRNKDAALKGMLNS